MKKFNITVVGAGIAGLSAAYDLQQAGHRVRVLEATAQAGGRTQTVQFGEHYLDCGTQFITADYRHILRLLQELGLKQELVAYQPWLGLLQGSKNTQINLNDPLQLMTSGILSWRQQLQLLPQVTKLYKSVKARARDDYGDWHSLDTLDIKTWAERDLGAGLCEQLLDPFVESLFFYPAEQASKAAALAFTRFFKKQFFTLKRGLGSLPQVLAAQLDVHYSQPVTALEIHGEQVQISTAQGNHVADYVVLATTSSAARALYTQADDLESALLSTGYAPSLTLNLLLDADFQHVDFDKMYGQMIPAQHRQHIAAITIDRKYANGQQGAKLLSLYLTERTASLMQHSDTEIQNALIAEAERYYPGLRQAVRQTQLSRWAEAIPYSLVGRSQHIQQYQQSPRKRVLLAGDYMGLSDWNSAAYTGIWAAEQIKQAAS